MRAYKTLYTCEGTLNFIDPNKIVGQRVPNERGDSDLSLRLLRRSPPCMNGITGVNES